MYTIWYIGTWDAVRDPERWDLRHGSHSIRTPPHLCGMVAARRAWQGKHRSVDKPMIGFKGVLLFVYGSKGSKNA